MFGKVLHAIKMNPMLDLGLGNLAFEHNFKEALPIKYHLEVDFPNQLYPLSKSRVESITSKDVSMDIYHEIP